MMPRGLEVEAGNKWEVQSIEKKRPREGTSENEYLVHWEGFSHQHGTWEAASTLKESAPEILTAFNSKGDPLKPKRKKKAKMNEQ